MTAPAPYCPDLLAYARRATREVRVGPVGIGGDNPIRVQSMITADTRDTAACVAEILALAEAGCEIVRLTAQTRVYAANLEHIARQVRAAGCGVPLVADIHFKPDAALEAAKWVEKVRVNPGNYVDKKKFETREYSDSQYQEELERIRAEFSPLVMRCKELGRAMRIGTNHGSLSDRIMNRYGDTPLGMVESALEFARIARDHGYHEVVFSMKASNPKVMIQAYRLLVARLAAEGPDWNYPIHLGVTEAGDGEDGRIKSAIGIGSLLEDGIGDTIRVSLTEDSIHEIPVARDLVTLTRGWDSGWDGGWDSGWGVPPQSVSGASRPGSKAPPQPSGAPAIGTTAACASGWGVPPQSVSGASRPGSKAPPQPSGAPVIDAGANPSGWGVPPQSVPGASRPGLAEDAQSIHPNWNLLVKGDSSFLPHWRVPGATYAVTFRLADSLPAEALHAYQQRRKTLIDRLDALKATGGSRSVLPDMLAVRAEMAAIYQEMVDAVLDLGHGACFLRQPEIAGMVENALKHFDGTRYTLFAWSVMPNHVHAVVRPAEKHALEDIVHSWKSFTAKAANKLLGREGTCWQAEYCDHLIRDGEDFRHQISYVLDNPGQGAPANRWTGSRYAAEPARSGWGVPPQAVAGASRPGLGVAQQEADAGEDCSGARRAGNGLGRDAPATIPPPFDPFSYTRRASAPVVVAGHALGGGNPVRVTASPEHWWALMPQLATLGEFKPEFPAAADHVLALDPCDDAAVAALNASPQPRLVTVADGTALHPIAAFRLLAAKADPRHPLLLKDTLGGETLPAPAALLAAATRLGSLLCDGIGDAVLIRGEAEPEAAVRLAYNILQAAGVRIFKADYVACPSCGRTLFNLQQTTRNIRAATGHLKGVRIAIMGCIVNGPGEMADADFGYVGGAPGKINLYVGKTPVEFNIPEQEAVARLIDLIRQHDKWQEPPPA